MVSRESAKGLILSLAVLWGLALLVGVIADQHYNGLLAHQTYSDGEPRNFLQFQLYHTVIYSAILSALLLIHWGALFRTKHSFQGQTFANFTLIFAMVAVAISWVDMLLDDYYGLSFFCADDAEPILNLDEGWRCEAAFKAQQTILPIIIVSLMAASLIARFATNLRANAAKGD